MREIRKLNAVRGWLWIQHGTQLLLRNPLLGIGGAFACMLPVLLTFALPLFGPLLALILLPILLAGYMRVCRALEEDERPDLSLLLAGFKQHTGNLVVLGVLLLVGMLFISTVMTFVGGAEFSALMMQVQSTKDAQVLMGSLSGASNQVWLAILLGFSLMLVLSVAWQFAPALVFFSGILPWQAVRASFIGTLRNILPYTVYTLIMQLIAMLLGILPYGLGMILLLPLVLASLYVSYRNIFPWLDEEQAVDASENWE